MCHNANGFHRLTETELTAESPVVPCSTRLTDIHMPQVCHD